jgi:hypothetical protein
MGEPLFEINERYVDIREPVFGAWNGLVESRSKQVVEECTFNWSALVQKRLCKDTYDFDGVITMP